MFGSACSLLAVAFSAAIVEAAAGVDGEVAAGRAPVDVLGPEQDSVTFTLVPGVGLQLRSGSTSLTLTYTPRVFYRLPNPLSFNRPLLLHQIALGHETKLDSMTSWTNGAELSVGELDYTAASLVFDPAVSSVRASLVDVLRAEAFTRASLKLTRRLDFSTELSADYTTSLDSTPSAPSSDPAAPMPDPAAPVLNSGDAVPESASVSLDASLGYSLGRFDRVSTNVDVTYQYFADGGRFLLVSPALSWDSQLSRRTSLGVSGGVAYVLTLEDARGNSTDSAFGGTGSAELGSELYKSGQMSVSSRVNASLEWFFDPILGTSQPRAGADLGLNLELGRQWFIGPNASFYTVLRAAGASLVDPMGMDAVDPAAVILPDATTLRAELPFRYTPWPTFSITWGGRAALRGRALTQDGFRLNEQVELWAFLGLTLRFGTGSNDASWLSM